VSAAGRAFTTWIWPIKVMSRVKFVLSAVVDLTPGATGKCGAWDAEKKGGGRREQNTCGSILGERGHLNKKEISR